MEENQTIISETNNIQRHNSLVQRIADAGFVVPEPSEVTGFRVGDIRVRKPKDNHPTSSGDTYESMLWYETPLPVAKIDYTYFYLVNTDKEALRDYQSQLRQLIIEFISSQTHMD